MRLGKTHDVIYAKSIINRGVSLYGRVGLLQLRRKTRRLGDVAQLAESFVR